MPGPLFLNVLGVNMNGDNGGTRTVSPTKDVRSKQFLFNLWLVCGKSVMGICCSLLGAVQPGIPRM